MQGIINRMKAHVKVCQPHPQVNTAEQEPQPSTSSVHPQSQSQLTTLGQHTG